MARLAGPTAPGIVSGVKDDAVPFILFPYDLTLTTFDGVSLFFFIFDYFYTMTLLLNCRRRLPLIFYPRSLTIFLPIIPFFFR